ncbi:hypothetical protein SELMODRAFT_405876 [Selaginella moellendorffii]|uniref:RING-type domain-containing protein n=1 Tax=Selaginella moellendorffii TaxID=88036 RepID=D8QZY9_SELML|nr:hypothetical protein SELMODRAFT_405876 [Selaginella moellendorffii]
MENPTKRPSSADSSTRSSRIGSVSGGDKKGESKPEASASASGSAAVPASPVAVASPLAASATPARGSRSSSVRKSSISLRGDKNVFKHAVETGCGHVFCARCLQNSFTRSKGCPTCDRPIEYVHPCFLLRELIVKYGGKRGARMLQTEFAPYQDDCDIPDIDDPIIIASQFVGADPGGTCSCVTGGIFDPSDLYFSEHLHDFVSVEEFLDTVKTINEIVAHATPGRAQTCMNRYVCFCLFYAHARNLICSIQSALADCNVRYPETGLWWTLMHLDSDVYSAGNLDKKMYLMLRIDPVKARNYQHTVVGGLKEGELARLRRENVLLRHKMLEIGQTTYLRGITARREKLKARGKFPHSFYAEYPDSYVISPRTLKQLVQFRPGRSTRAYFLPPWARVRSMSSGLLPLNREEDYVLSKLGSGTLSRSMSPYRRPSDASAGGRRSESGPSNRDSISSARIVDIKTSCRLEDD